MTWRLVYPLSFALVYKGINSGLLELDDHNATTEEFMRLVEAGEPRVYTEESSPRSIFIYFLVPIIVGAVLGFTILIIAITVEVTFTAPLFFGIILIPTFAGFLIGVVLIVKSVGKGEEFRVREIPRSELSLAIAFLDMIREGKADVGKITDPRKPEEYRRFTSLVLSITLKVLNKLDPEISKKWFEKVSQKLSQEFGFAQKLFLRVAFFGSIVAFVAMFLVDIFRRMTLIDAMLALYIMIPLAIFAAFMLIVLVAYVLKYKNAEPPENVVLAISDPEVRTETESVMKRIFDMVVEEGEYPLRVLVLGEYSELEYTDRTYDTDRGLVLREAVLIPRSSR